MADENLKIRQQAISQLFKYTGNEVQKIQAEIKGDIEVSFSPPEE